MRSRSISKPSNGLAPLHWAALGAVDTPRGGRHRADRIFANRIHNEAGRKVRQTIHELGGTMPENLPVAESIKKVASREKKRLKVG